MKNHPMPARPCGAEVSVVEFGAVGDGVADDTAAIQAALGSGARRVLIPAGVFRIRRALEPMKDQHVVVQGTIRLADAEIQRLTRDVSPGDSEVELVDASGFAVGEWVSLHDDLLPIQGGGRKTRRQGAGSARILSLSGNRVTLDGTSARAYRCTANAVLARQHAGIWIRHSGVRISGGGILDGNRRNQLNAAPGFLASEHGEDWRAASGIVAAGDSTVSGLVIEDVTVCDFALHGICLQDAELSVIRRTTCLRMHDKSITLHRCRDIRIMDNTCCDSEFEDGIMLHQVSDPAEANRRILIQGNTCRNNARFGIHVGANMREIFLANNQCVENGLNLSLYGDHCTSTGDVAIGTTDRLFQSGVYRPNVLVVGSHNTLVNLTALGTRFVGVELSGRHNALIGGLVGEMEGPAPERSCEGLDVSAGEWGAGSGEFYVRGDCRVGVAVVPDIIRRREIVVPEHIRISGLCVSGCRVAVKIADGVNGVFLSGNDLGADEKVMEGGERVVERRDPTGF